MQSILTDRLKKIREVRNLWKEEAIKASVEKMSKIRDSSVLFDILRILVLKPSLFSLDVAVELLPLITELLFEIYEEFVFIRDVINSLSFSYLRIACTTITLLSKSFSSLIITTINLSESRRIDVALEDR